MLTNAWSPGDISLQQPVKQNIPKSKFRNFMNWKLLLPAKSLPRMIEKRLFYMCTPYSLDFGYLNCFHFLPALVVTASFANIVTTSYTPIPISENANTVIIGHVRAKNTQHGLLSLTASFLFDGLKNNKHCVVMKLWLRHLPFTHLFSFWTKKPFRFICGSIAVEEWLVVESVNGGHELMLEEK